MSKHADEDSRKRIHETISSKITVYYPFHALQGLELDVVCTPRKGDGAITIIDPTGFRLKIPAWMVSPEATRYMLSDQAQICPGALLSLANLLNTLKETSSSSLTTCKNPPHNELEFTKGEKHETNSFRVSDGDINRVPGSSRPGTSKKVGD